MNTLRVFFFTTLLGLGLAMSFIAPSYADDTEIYMRQADTNLNDVRPNILFVLDRSGSMSWKDYDINGKTDNIKRLDHLKTALKSMLDEVQNVNIGLMTFTYDGGSNVAVEFPIFNIDSQISEVKGEAGYGKISTAVSRSSDDAEELVEGTKKGTVNITDTILRITDIGAKEQETATGLDTLIKYYDASKKKSFLLGKARVVDNTGKTVATTLVDGKFRQVPQLTGGNHIRLPDHPNMEVGSTGTVSFWYKPDSTSQKDFKLVYREDGSFNIAVTSSGKLQVTSPNKETLSASSFTQTSDWMHVAVTWDTSGTKIYFNGKNITSNSAGPAVTINAGSTGWQFGGMYASNTNSALVGLMDDIVITNTAWTETEISNIYRDSINHIGYSGLPVAIEYNTYTTATSTTNNGMENISGSSVGTLNASNNVILAGKSTYTVLTGLRFEDVALPKDATIVDASVIFTASNSPTTSTTFKIRAKTNPPTIPSGSKTSPTASEKISNWTTSSDTNVSWTVTSTWASGKRNSGTVTSSLTNIITPLLANSAWIGDGKDDLGIVFDPTGSTITERTFYSTVTSNYKTYQLPVLTIIYQPATTSSSSSDSSSSSSSSSSSTSSTETEGSRLIGIRFSEVSIPQGAKITKANIIFGAARSSETPATMEIHGEASDNAATFSATNGNISSRATTGAKITWDADAWVENDEETTTNLTEVVQEIVNRGGWCGGNAMAFIFSNPNIGTDSPLRRAYSYDDAASNAPKLQIEYDPASVSSSACSQSSYLARITDKNDDGEETVIRDGSADDSMFLTSTELEMTTTVSGNETKRMLGFRFPQIPIKAGETITSAELYLTAIPEDTSQKAKYEEAFKVTIKGEAGNAAGFNGSKSGDFSSRSKTAGVAWQSDEIWKSGKTYISPDISSVVQSIVNSASWKPNEAMALFIEGDGLRYVASREHESSNPARPSAMLKIKIRGKLASSTSDDSVSSDTTVRARMKTLVDEVVPGGATPLVDALYEATSYYKGMPVVYGLDRFGQNTNRVSHRASYSAGGAVVYREDGCTDADLDASACASEEIKGGAPTYIQPSFNLCAQSHAVLLTDGEANGASAGSKAQALTGKSPCATSFVIPKGAPNAGQSRTYDSDEKCGPELAEYMYTSDFDSSIEGSNVVLNTIGLSLKIPHYGIARYDNVVYNSDKQGRTYKKIADDNVAAGLWKIAKTWTKTVSSTTQTWITYEDVNQTKANTKAMQYLAQLALVGGGSFYTADSADSLLEAFRTIIAGAITESTSYASPSVSVSAFNRLYHRNEVYFALFKPEHLVRWNGNVKKYMFCDGTSGSCPAGDILDATGKSAVVSISNGSSDEDGGYISKTAKSFWSSDVDGSIVTKGGAGENVPKSTERKVYTVLADTPPTQDNNATIDTVVSTATTGLGSSLSATAKQDLVNWILGQDVNDEDGDNDTSENRWAFADPLHSSPAVITYSTSGSNSNDKIFVGTNDGLIRMLDAQTGIEEWAFLPKELFGIQPEIMKNAQSTDRIYGMDGTPQFWIKDANLNGNIEAGDAVRMYFNMRSGGRNIYALNVTNPEGPKLMWVIQGGADADYAKLGLTWSAPRPAVVKIDGVNTVVLIFGGGYPSGGESDTTTNSNAIYMVDAKTGKRLWWASDTGASLNLKEMTYAIPSDIALMDSNGDGVTDRLYVGDLGGQVWRIDLDGLANGKSAKGGLLAQLAGESEANARKFYYPPEIAHITNSACAIQPRYDAVAIASGNRNHPLETIVQDRFYLLRDRAVDGLSALPDTSFTANQVNTGACKQTPGSQGTDTDALFCTITTANLFDASANTVQEGSANDKILLRSSKGYFLNLDAAVGEKSLASPLILDGVAYFTTYAPPSADLQQTDENVCSAGDDGSSRLYAVSLCDAGAAFDINGDGNKADGDETKDDRSQRIRDGITSDISTIFLKNGDIRILSNDLDLGKRGAGNNNEAAGKATLSPTYWLQFPE